MELNELSLKEKETLIFLLKKEGSAEEIQEALKLSYKEGMNLLRKLLSKKFIEKIPSFPTKYKVRDKMKKKVREIEKILDWSELEREEFYCRKK